MADLAVNYRFARGARKVVDNVVLNMIGAPEGERADLIPSRAQLCDHGVIDFDRRSEVPHQRAEELFARPVSRSFNDLLESA